MRKRAGERESSLKKESKERKELDQNEVSGG
jgi:hypothetical protein